MGLKDATMHDLVPSVWLDDPNSKVRVTAYRIVNYGDFKPDQLSGSSFFSSEVRSVIAVGGISYPSFDFDWDLNGPKQQITAKVGTKVNDKHGAWLLILQPFDEKKNVNGNLDVALSSCVGMYLAVFGRGIAFEQQFQVLITPNNGTEMSSPAMINPNFLGETDLSRRKFILLNAINNKISEAPNAIRERFKLSLHWFEKGLRQNGTDALLSLWIAIEALAMRSPDIIELKRILKEIYDSEEVEQRFQIGRIFGLRSKIVHDGLISSINVNLLDYLEAVYVDLLLHLLRIEPEYCIKEFLNNKNISVEELLNG